MFLLKGFVVALFMLFLLNMYWGIEIIVAVHRKIKFNINDRLIEYRKNESVELHDIFNNSTNKVVK